MPTVLDLAEHAGVSPDTVVRVLLREPTNEEACRKVSDAVAALGMPDYPRPDQSVEVVPLEPSENGAAPPAVAPLGGADLAVELRDLLKELVDGVRRERRERIEDVALTNELVIEGWKSIDRRLGRLEKIFERLNRYAYFEGQNGNGSSARLGSRR